MIVAAKSTPKAMRYRMIDQQSPTATSEKWPGLASAAVLSFGLIAVFVIVDLLFFAQGQSFKREGGGLETASAVLYILAVVVFFIKTPMSEWLRLFHVPALMALFACRELDFDKAFTDAGILSLRLYSGDTALGTKLIAGAVALFSIYVILRTAWRGGPAVLRALRDGALWPWFAILAGVLVVGTKSVDGLGRKLLDFGIVISADLDATASLVEEVGETFIPVCAILAIAARWRGRKT
ncbi:hypothetical protein [Roseobacter litoralis]|uniref:hypothetical protein n=1 Tax=Roseobacter litoralis TaxID=42443 RepID=UPI0024951483|nr:hypothetical protein [Roseobacter litoralis]